MVAPRLISSADITTGTGVLATGSQATGLFLPVFTRIPAGRASGGLMGFWTGTTTFNGVTDPLLSFGYIGGTGELSSTIQLEADWNIGATNDITEWYWQIVTSAGTSYRPFYGKYNAYSHTAVNWTLMIGNGLSDSGAALPGFFVSWDDNSNPVGVSCFSVTPNRLNLYPVSNGGISADHTRLRLFSATGKGSEIAMTYNGQDAEGSFWPTFLLNTVGQNQTNIRQSNTYTGYWYKPSATQAALNLVSGVKLGDGTTMRAAMWSSTGAPSSGMGANGDWCVSDNGSLYVKAAGAWSVKV